MNGIRNIIGMIFFAIAAIPFCIAAIVLNKDMRSKITMRVLESFPIGEQTIMSEREKLFVRMALGYMLKNLDDVNEAFEFEDDDAYGCVIVDGSVESEVEEEELQELLEQFTNETKR